MFKSYIRYPFILFSIFQQQTYEDRATEPKVQVPFVPEPGKPPRKIEIERRRRLWAQMDITELLQRQGVDFSAADGCVVVICYRIVLLKVVLFSPWWLRSMKLYKGYLPLEAFDDTSFDPREPEEWIAMSKVPTPAPYPPAHIHFVSSLCTHRGLNVLLSNALLPALCF